MKRLLIISFTFFMTIFIGGCNNVKKDNKEKILKEINDKINLKIESNEYFYNINTINCVVNDLVNNETNETDIDIISKTIFEEVSNLFLDSDLVEKIEFDFQKQFGYKLYYNDYYGSYNEAYFLFVEGDAQFKKDIIISDVIFRYNCDWDIYVWYQDKFYFIDEAFDTEIFNYETLKKISQIHYLKTVDKYYNFELKDRNDYFNLSFVRI